LIGAWMARTDVRALAAVGAPILKTAALDEKRRFAWKAAV
jgi:hypothetical protein